MIRKIETSDIPFCLEIYNYYIKNTTVTLEEACPTLEEFGSRVRGICEKKEYCWLVYEENGEVLGYAYLDKFNPRSAYRISCDLSIYLRTGTAHRGIGRKLFEAVCAHAREHGIECIVSIITAENENSCGFHEKLGFTKAGELPDVAFKFGRHIGVCFYLYHL